MKVQFRNNKVVLDGYVNTVDRFSKVLQDKKGKFIEKIMPNAFTKALKRTDNVPVLLNHNDERVLANTSNATAKLYEDNVGLRLITEIDDAEVIDDAKNGKLRGCSFRFVSNSSSEKINEDGIEERSITDLDLYEVSIINSKKIPAYAGTSIELRNNNKVLMEYRYTDENMEIEVETKPVLTSNQKRELLQNKLRENYSNAWIDDIDDKFIYASNLDEECSIFKIGYTISENNEINIDISNQVKVMRGGYIEVNKVPEQQSERKVEKIDYSSYEERLKKIKEERK